MEQFLAEHWHTMIAGLAVGRLVWNSEWTGKHVREMNGTLGQVKESTDACQAVQKLCPYAQPQSPAE